MPQPEYFIRGLHRVPNLRNTLVLDIGGKGPLPVRPLKSGQVVRLVRKEDAVSEIAKWENDKTLDRLFVKGVNETPELERLRKDHEAGLLKYMQERHGNP